MSRLQEKLLEAFLASHHGVVSRQEALSLGFTDEQVRWYVRTGMWVAVQRGVYRRAGSPAGPEGQLLAACLAAGRDAVASHASAAWLWQLIPSAPPRPCLTVPRATTTRIAGVQRHRRDDIDPKRTLIRAGIPVTDPLRTLADLGEAVAAVTLDDAIDRGLARRLITIEGLDHEVDRLAQRGRRGVPRLRAALLRRGLVAAPHPSVLESRTLRLLRRWGIVPAGVEVAVCDGRYRLDVLLHQGIALEVDGYAYHWSPEAKAADSQRRNLLRLSGIIVVEADWVTVMHQPERLRRTLLAALQLASGSPAGSAS